MSPRQPYRIELRLSESDRDLLERLANEEGLRPATFLRWLIHQQARRGLSTQDQPPPT